MRKKYFLLASMFTSLLAMPASAASPQRFRTPAPAEDQDPLIETPVFGSDAGHENTDQSIYSWEWVAKRIWHHFDLPWEIKDYQGPPNLAGKKHEDGALSITETVMCGGVPVRNGVLRCEIEQVDRDKRVLILQRCTDAFGEVLIELNLHAGWARSRSITVSRSMIGGQSHSSPMPQQSSYRIIAESKFPAVSQGFHQLRIRTQGAQIVVFVNDERVFSFTDPDPAGGKFGFGSTGTVRVRNINQSELISAKEQRRREACWDEMHAFSKELDTHYSDDVTRLNRVTRFDDGAEWTYLRTGTSGRFTVRPGGIDAVIKSGLFGDETLVDGTLPGIAVIDDQDRMFTPDPNNAPRLTMDAFGAFIEFSLVDKKGNHASAFAHARFTVQNLWFWTATAQGIAPKYIQAFVGVAPAFATPVDESATSTQTPNIADNSIAKHGIYAKHNTKVGVYVKKLVDDTIVGVKTGGGNEIAISTTGKRLRFATMWYPAQPLNKIGFSKRMVHYIRYPEGPVQHWRRRPSYQEYPTNVDLHRFRGHGTDAMVWHHTWISCDYRDREGVLVNEPELRRAADETHGGGMAVIG